MIDASTEGATASIDVNLANSSLVVKGVTGLGSLNFTVQNFRNVTGTSQNDSIIGDAQDNSLSGLGGNDLLSGGLGNDQLFGGEGDDTLIGSQGNDVLDGGSGFDTADFSSLLISLLVQPTGTAIRSGSSPQTTQLTDIENIISSTFSLIDASAASAESSIDVNLTNKSLIVKNLSGQSDRSFTIQNFTNVTGSSGNDLIAGDLQRNVLSGLAGDDTFIGSGSRDTINGGAGFDTIDYSNLGGSITLLPTGTVNKCRQILIL